METTRKLGLDNFMQSWDDFKGINKATQYVRSIIHRSIKSKLTERYIFRAVRIIS